MDLATTLRSLSAKIARPATISSRCEPLTNQRGYRIMARGKLAIPDIDPSTLRDIFSYNPKSGKLKWRRTRCHRLQTGDTAGCRSRKGRIVVKIGAKSVFASRLIWAYMTGTWPTKQIDHINRDPSDNRWRNLREVTSAQNAWNTRISRDNSSGSKGVTWNKNEKRWRVRIMVNGTTYLLGRFLDKWEAIAAYEKAAIEIHGEFSAHHIRPSGAKR